MDDVVKWLAGRIKVMDTGYTKEGLCPEPALGYYCPSDLELDKQLFAEITRLRNIINHTHARLSRAIATKDDEAWDEVAWCIRETRSET